MKKKLIFSSLLFSGILISCGKTEIKTQDAASTNEEIVLRSGNGGPGGNGEILMKIFFDDGTKPGVEGKTFGCAGVGGYCNKKNGHGIYHPILEDIRLEGEANYVTNFSLYQDELSQIFGTALVDGVIAEELSLEIKGSITSSSSAYFIFGDETGTISVAQVGL
jgi:hypothetical protein